MLSIMEPFPTSVDDDADTIPSAVAGSTVCRVVTPVPGTVAPLSSVPDPRFASGAFGAGAAVVPDFDVNHVTALAPVSGELRRLMPHFFLIVAESGVAVYVQLGIDTDMLDGTGFSPHACEGDRVVAGQRITTYSPRQIGRLGFDPVIPVVALQQDAVVMRMLPGEPCEPGDVLFVL